MKSPPCLTSSQESEASALPENELDSAQSDSRRSTPTLAPSSESIGQECRTTETSETSPRNSLAMWMSLQEAFLASLSASPGRGVEIPTKGTYGPNCAESLAKFGPNGACWRMCQDSFQMMLDGSLEEFSGTWPRSGMMLSGTVYQLPPLVQIIAETESGFWPTPCKDGNGGSHGKAKLNRMLSTPTVCGDWNRKGASATSGDGINTQLGGPQHPNHREWMMGYPKDHTDATFSETQSFRKLRKSSSKKSCAK